MSTTIQTPPESAPVREVMEFIPGETSRVETTPAKEKEAAPPIVEKPVEQAPAPPQLNDQERAAVAEGWRPKTEWKGDPGKWIDAGNYLHDLPFKKHIAAQTRHNKELEATIENFKGHLDMVRKSTYQKAWNEFSSQRKEAIQLGDVEKVEAIEGEMRKLNEEVAPPAPTPKKEEKIPEPPPEAKNWAKDNEWFFVDPELGAAADTYLRTLAQRDSNLSIKDLLDKTAAHIKRVFPEKFENQNRTAPPMFEGGNNFQGSGGAKKYTYNDLPTQAKNICDSFVRRGMVKDNQTYVDDLVESGFFEGGR